MVKVKFTKDFATMKKGDTFNCDSLLANRLIKSDKVAKLVKSAGKQNKQEEK